MLHNSRMKILPSLLLGESGSLAEGLAIDLLNAGPTHQFFGNKRLDEVAANAQLGNLTEIYKRLTNGLPAWPMLGQGTGDGACRIVHWNVGQGR